MPTHVETLGQEVLIKLNNTDRTRILDTLIAQQFLNQTSINMPASTAV
jgi:hypothetical protein